MKNISEGKDYLLESFKSIREKKLSDDDEEIDYEEDNFEQDCSDDERTLADLQREKLGKSFSLED